MKETIYTIPVNEAFDDLSECPFCYMVKKLEDEGVEYALGAAMMEPDYRVLSNEKGYCNKHFGMLFKKPNKLSLALVMDTHFDELRKKLSEVSKSSRQYADTKHGFFKREKQDPIQNAKKSIDQCNRSCIICEKVDDTIERYIRVFFGLWENDNEFRRKVETSKGFCLPHFSKLLDGAKKYLGSSKYAEFCKMICEKEEAELERVHNDVHNFTLKFDYRNHSSKWGTEKDGPVRGVEKIAGYIIKDNK
ncbi:MAG: ABC transporter substrate-binding protein [Clostridia bacterium]|nr:ABC transporter substrate-binding protein [Clostridia bacterium]